MHLDWIAKNLDPHQNRSSFIKRAVTSLFLVAVFVTQCNPWSFSSSKFNQKLKTDITCIIVAITSLPEMKLYYILQMWSWATSAATAYVRHWNQMSVSVGCECISATFHDSH